MSEPAYLGAGFGLRRPHLAELLAEPALTPAVLELTPSHVFGDVERLAPLVGRCAFVLHDLLGSPATLAPLPRAHLERVRLVARRVDAHAYSDHLAMVRAPGGLELGHLVPTPLTHELLEHLCARVRALRELLELPIALELPTTSLSLPPLPGALDEGAFMHELVAHGGCGLHLDLENLRVDAANGLAPLPSPLLDASACPSARRELLAGRLRAGGLPPELAELLAARLDALPLAAVTRVHLAGGSRAPDGWHVDSHAAPVHPHSLALLDALRGLIEPRALIIERDTQLPSLGELSAEARALDERWRRSGAARPDTLAASMLYATLTIDLPSEPVLRRKTLVDWLAEMIGREVDLSTDREVCTATGVSVFKAVSDALARVGITDVLSVTIDDKTAYVDTDENSGDLPAAVAELDARAVLEREFEHMSMVSMHRSQQLRTLVEVGLHRRVERGAPELRVEIASRHDAMQVTRGEQPGAYAERLGALAREPGPLIEAHARLEALSRALASALEDELGALALAVERGPVRLRLIRPGPRALDRMRQLSWGPAVRMPRYRPVPVHTRRGAYREPFSHHYFDPYFDFASYVTLREIVAGRGWPGLAFEVVDAEGSPAFDASSASTAAPLVGPQGPTHAPLLSITERGLKVSESVPRFEGPAPGELVDPTSAAGFAGSDAKLAGEPGGWQGVADAGGVSGGELGGSCGASCGGCGG